MTTDPESPDSPQAPESGEAAAADAPPARRRRRWVPFVAAAVGVVAALLIALLAFSPNSNDQNVTSPVVGKQAPAIKATETNGKKFSLEDLRGGWVLVNFFATWCAPCKAEQPQLIQWANEHSGQDFLVSVSFNDQASKVKKFFQANGGDWPVIAQGNADIALDYGVIELPESYLVAPSGVVAAKFNGGVTASGLDSIIARAEGTK
jgi:cytochrome c biogenesis protein CcmG/thiol:disulfide interchange protein DsbE